MRARLHKGVCMCAYIVCLCVCLFVLVCVSVCAFVRACMRVLVHVCARVYMHVQVCVCALVHCTPFCISACATVVHINEKVPV